MKRAAFALFLSQLFAVAVFAQEFGRATGGNIDLITKHTQPFSGSLALSAGTGRGFDLGLGGTLVKDRVWFFATAERKSARMFTQLGDNQSVTASAVALPSSFLSLHYTGIVSNNMFVTASFSEFRRTGFPTAGN